MSQYAEIANPPERVRITFSRLVEDDNFTNSNEHDEFSPERLEDFNNGKWCFIGVRALAKVEVPIGGGSVCTYTLKSAGLWGIESDSDEKYLDEVYADQVMELHSHIRQFSDADIIIDGKEG